MANSSRVAEIFQQASVAFGRLAQLTIDLKLAQIQQADAEQKENERWTNTEIEQLKEAVARFGNDLGKIAEAIETKTLAQIKQKIKTKALQEAGLNEANPPEAEKTNEEHTSVSEPPTISQTPVLERGRRKQNLDGVSEDVSNTKHPRLNEFLDISVPTDVKRDKPVVERSASLDLPSVADVKNDGTFFKRQVRPTPSSLPVGPSCGPPPNLKPASEALKAVVNRPVPLLPKPSLRFDPTPTMSDLSGSKYDYEDSEDGEDPDEYEDFDDDDDAGIESTQNESED
ncbi:Chromatin complexes subunit BAP18 [Fasciola gigantica]|uniref:Chromatin complexes subunit BAP18 n=1 Tax=Fasciola gigantica TaxID=46835 RepID=A0A504YFN9_FASGI|nr:Chromatin complexes subunit BAP18 [Fasciola gigantica]